MQDCFQAWAKTRLETHKPAKPDSMHFEVLSNRPPVRCSFFRPSLWTTHLAVCKFGHVCGHPSNRPGHIISTFTELDGTIYLVTALWSSWSKTGQNTMVSGFQIFPAIQQYQWQDFFEFSEDHGPCHAVDCIDKTVRVRNDAEAVERMLGQAISPWNFFRDFQKTHGRKIGPWNWSKNVLQIGTHTYIYTHYLQSVKMSILKVVELGFLWPTGTWMTCSARLIPRPVPSPRNLPSMESSGNPQPWA